MRWLWAAPVAIGACWLTAGIARAETHWVDYAESAAFRCRADFPLTGQAALLHELSVLEADLAEILALEQAEESIELFLFRNRDTYREFLKQQYPGVPLRRALFIKHRGPGMVFAYQSDAIATDLRHEATHALLQARIRGLPFWLDEGLAEYFEVPRTQRYAGNPHLVAVRQRCRTRQVPSLAALAEIRELDQMGGEQYRDSWAWVHFMLHGPAEARLALLDYLRELGDDRVPESLEVSLYRRVPGLETRFLDHFAPRLVGAKSPTMRR